MLYLHKNAIIKCAILKNVRIHNIIVYRNSILAISIKHLGLPKCTVSKLTCFPQMDSVIRHNDKCNNSLKDLLSCVIPPP